MRHDQLVKEKREEILRIASRSEAAAPPGRRPGRPDRACRTPRKG